MAKKMSLNAWINSQLKNKGLTVKQAKKNAGKYKSIAAAKKAGSLYYTNKDGKIMIAAYAEDLKMPLKRPKSMEKSKFPAIDTSKITKTELPPPSSSKAGPKRKTDNKGLSGGDPSKSDLIITQINRIKSKKGDKLSAGERAKLDSVIKKIKEGGNISGMTKILDTLESRIDKRNKGMNMGGITMKKKGKSKMNMGGMMSPTKRKPTGSATGLTGMKGGGMMKKKGMAKGGAMMKKKGYAMGGAMKRPTANQKGLKKLPTAVRNKMGYMAKGGMMKKKGMAKGGATMKKKGMARGGAMMKKKGMARGGAARRGR
tara:strand:+ start:326 stop:1267 length:942 start_codon:yes stop_codon:yes gene_type:complete